MCKRCINHEMCQGTGCKPKNDLQELIDKNKDSVIKTIEEQPKVGEWISVEKELPKEKGYYLVTRKGHTCAEVRQFRGKKWAVDTQHFGEVIAWQPLPKPYKGE